MKVVDKKTSVSLYFWEGMIVLYLFCFILFQVRQVALKVVLSQQAYLLFYTRLTSAKQESQVRLHRQDSC